MKRLIKHPLSIYTILFFIIILIVFVPFLIGGGSLIWNADGITQHFPALIQWHHDLRNLFFNHKLPSAWDWNISLGQDYLQTFSYYVMGDIFTYPLILVKSTHLIEYYNLMILIRLWLAGAALIFVAPRLTKHTFSNWVLSAGGIIYTFSGFTAFIAFEHPFFINPLIIFPLLCWSLIRFIRTGRWKLLTIMVAWTLWNNFYFAFMLALATFLIWLWFLLTQPQLRKRTLQVFGPVIIGALISAPLFLPSVLATMNAVRTNTVIANGMWLYPINYYLALPGNIIGNESLPLFWLNGGMSFISVTAIIFSFRRFKKYINYNLIWIITMVGLCFPIFSAVFNGGTSPSNRWLLLICLPVALISMELLENLDQLAIRDLQITGILGGIATLSLFISHNLNVNLNFGLLIAAFFSGLLTLALLINHPLQKKTKIWLLIIISLGLSILMIRNHSKDYNPDSTSLVPKQTIQALLKNQKTFKTLDQDQPRIYVDQQLGNINGIAPASNLPIAAGLNNIESYWSLQNKSTNQFLAGLQIQSSNPNDVIGNLDHRNLIFNILGVKNIWTNTEQNVPKSYLVNEQATTKGLIKGETQNSYPRLYLPKYSVNPKTYQKLSPTEKEATLVDSVVVKGGTQHSDFAKKVQTIPIALNGSENWKSSITTTYKTHPSLLPDGINIKANPKLKGMELHLEITNLSYKAATWGQRKQIAYTNYVFNNHQNHQNPQKDSDLRINPTGFKLNWYKNNLNNFGRKVGGYNIDTTYQKQINSVYQSGANNLSFYQHRSALTINLGPAKQYKKDQFIPLEFSQDGTYHYTITMKAVPIDNRFDQVAKQIQKNAPILSYKDNQLTSKITVSKGQWLTSTIPWSNGWTSSTHKIKAVNQGMIGIKLHQGVNYIKLEYKTPGLNIGIILGIIGTISLIILIIFTAFFHNKKA
ncbi:glycosyltransferase [Weissella koreensis KACC 15510]|uniref:YfhO family protein n=1 Tax=Weissella koreensis TaxID=165096 RepID=UPI0002174AF6|nr:YfhO family protein [Weissella koreensis]AEJ23244.1 glycosyltransferase [Weissella koreensis KACC 15510]